jgi:hypothetical protein
MSDPGRYRCERCRMSFRIGERPREAAVSRCGVCKLLFWHADRYGDSSFRVTVGITPAELAQQGGKVTA